MESRNSVATVATLVLLVGAASGTAVAQPADARAAQDQRELQAYVLTMEVLQKVAKANHGAGAPAAKDPGQQKLSKQQAELAALEAKEQPTAAEQERMMVLGDEIARAEEAADLGHGGDAPDQGTTISAFARQVDATPALAASVRAAGLSSREYATAMLALLQAGLTNQLLEQKMLKQAPPDVPKQHLEFLRVHAREIAALGIIPADDGAARKR